MQEKIKKASTTKQKLKQKTNVNKVCACRIPSEEYARLEAEVMSLGYKSMSDYFRTILLDRKKEISNRELEEYRLFLAGKVSNNINQIAKSLNIDLLKNEAIEHKKTQQLVEAYIDSFFTLLES
jgi:hypothetical protein